MLKRIPLNQLAVGMFVECYGDGSYETPHFTFRDFIHDDKQIAGLKALGLAEVTIDSSKSKTQPHSPSQDETFSRGADTVPEATRKLYSTCLSHVSDTMEKVRQGLSVDYAQSYDTVDAIIAGVDENPAHMTLLAKLHKYDDYTLKHSLNVSLLCVIFGRHLGIKGGELRRLGFAGLYHDIGKFKIPLEILNKPGKLSEREFEIMKLHSSIGYELLKDKRGITEDVLMGVLHHHERYDGKGYPHQLKADEKNPFSRILTIVDIFDALNSDRAYKKAFTPHESLKAMFAWRNESLHPGLLEQFVTCFGVYPPGSFVRLTDKTCGVVVEARSKSPARPLVKVSFTRKLVPRLPKLVDLSSMPPATKGGLDIEAYLDPKLFGVRLERFL